MTAYIALTADGAAVTDYSDYEVAAFCGDECRGVGEIQTAGTATYVYMRIRSNQASGETVTFKVYVKSTNMEVDVKDYTMNFTNQAVQGMPSSPVVLNFVPFTPGDANGDGEINVGDVSAMVNYIIGTPATGTFIPAAADLNGDGEINVGDLSAVINIIINQ